jgi:hypothetical protein
MNRLRIFRHWLSVLLPWHFFLQKDDVAPSKMPLIVAAPVFGTGYC